MSIGYIKREHPSLGYQPINYVQDKRSGHQVTGHFRTVKFCKHFQ
jgi:hypothetical protein